VETSVVQPTQAIKTIDPVIKQIFIEAEPLTNYRREVRESLPGRQKKPLWQSHEGETGD